MKSILLVGNTVFLPIWTNYTSKGIEVKYLTADIGGQVHANKQPLTRKEIETCFGKVIEVNGFLELREKYTMQ